MTSETGTTPPGENVAQTVRDLMTRLGPAEPVETPDASGIAKAHLVSVPAHRTIENITGQVREAAEFAKPARRRGTARLADLDSFIAWAQRFKGETSAIFADPDMDRPALTCIADYHGEGAADVTSAGGDPTARHCAHRGIYDFPLSDEWKAWTGISGAGLDKDELGEFIEANAKDIMDPTPAILAMSVTEANAPWENRLIETARQIEGRYGQLARLLQLSKRFQVHETSDLTVKTNRDTGEAEVQFLNEHKDAEGRPLEIPNLLIVAIPVFRNGAAYRMPVRFRYRKSGATVKFILSVYNPEKAFEAAFREAVSAAADATGLPTFLGTPES